MQLLRRLERECVYGEGKRAERGGGRSASTHPIGAVCGLARLLRPDARAQRPQQ